MNDARRGELLDAAVSLLAERGFSETSLRNVATRAGCTTGSVTHHFADRQALLVALLVRAHEAAALRMLVKANTSRTPMQRLRAVLLEALPLDRKRMIEWRVWLAFWNEAATNPDIARENARRYHEWRATLDALLQPFVTSHAARTERVETWVALIDGLGLGLVTEGKRTPREAAVEQTIAAVDRLLRSFR
jgi:AcrR family transcriptional regulator